MFSMSLFPLITRPSRITSQSTTLIDNIFSNIVHNNTTSGLLFSDSSDHLPVFAVYDINCRKTNDTSNVKYTRIRTEESINVFKTDLLAQNWDPILNENDIDIAYDTFLETFKRLYDTNCPIRMQIKRHSYTSCPWLTKGLINACKKKNFLYR